MRAIKEILSEIVNLVEGPNAVQTINAVCRLVLVERERCALVAEEFRKVGDSMTNRDALCENIATSIRDGRE